MESMTLILFAILSLSTCWAQSLTSDQPVASSPNDFLLSLPKLKESLPQLQADQASLIPTPQPQTQNRDRDRDWSPFGNSNTLEDDRARERERERERERNLERERNRDRNGERNRDRNQNQFPFSNPNQNNNQDSGFPFGRPPTRPQDPRDPFSGPVIPGRNGDQRLRFPNTTAQRFPFPDNSGQRFPDNSVFNPQRPSTSLNPAFSNPFGSFGFNSLRGTLIREP